MQVEFCGRPAARCHSLPCQAWPLARPPPKSQSASFTSQQRLSRTLVTTAATGRPRKTKSEKSETTSGETTKRKRSTKKSTSKDSSEAGEGVQAEAQQAAASGSVFEKSQSLTDEADSSQTAESDQDQEDPESSLPDQDELQEEVEGDAALLQILIDEELESRQYQDADFLPTTRASPLLTNREVWERMLQAAQMANGSEYKAFYSSDLGGIVTHPALMVVGIDDHMIHRGHAVFDTALLTQGYVYQLRQHLERLADSAAKAGIDSPVSMSQMERIVLETAAASRLLNGSIRFWLSAGRGDFSLSPSECSPTFYCIVFVPAKSPFDEIGDGVEGMRVKTSIVPPKHDYFATLKSTNYLQNALALMDAQDSDIDQAIFVTADGHVAEASNANLGIVTAERDLIMPPFDHSLRGITAETVLSLARQYLETGELENVRSIEQRPITLEEAQAADEVFLCSSTLSVAPVIVWDGVRINEGESGLVTMSLRAMIIRHMNPQFSLGEHLEVPYGFVTGMR